MCLSSNSNSTPSAPEAPPPLPEPATLVNAAASTAISGKNRRLPKTGFAGTILTGQRGVTTPEATSKTILGG